MAPPQRTPMVAAFFVAACFSLASAAEVTPIQKVVAMMEEMLAKGKQEKHNEEVEFAKFSQWCTSLREDKTESIAEAKAKIEQLTADIAKAESDAEVLGNEIEELEADVVRIQGEIKNATEVREKEHADYAATHEDYSESIDAIQRAIMVLQQRSADVPQTESLLQLQKSSLIPARTKAAIESFLAMGSADAEAAPEANAYEFQSQSVIDMLEKLLKKFSDERLALEKAEMSAKGNYEVLMQQLTDDEERDGVLIKEKTAAKAGRLEDAAAAKGDLEITETGLVEDEKALADANAECEAKSEEFEKNQVTRAAEIKAIETAIETLESDAVSGNAEKHLSREVSDAKLGAEPALAQLRSSTHEDPATRQRVATFLQGRARKLGSRYLSLVAARAAEDPFAKVKKMIKDLIVKLMEEANEEADKKGFCDAELATNKQTREIKTAEVEELMAGVEKATAESAQLATEIAELSDAITEIKRLQAEATQIRGEEKEKNAVVIADSKEGQAAVEKAIQVLKEFYEGAAGASLLQGGAAALAAAMKAASAEPYKGMQAESGGIIGMLEVILSDFARLETETSVAEDQAQAAYEKFMNESDEDVAVKETEVEHKTNKKQRTDETNRDLKKQLALTQEELDAANAYYEKLKPDCVDLGLSYEERKRMREEEIESLKEALKILSGEDLA